MTEPVFVKTRFKYDSYWDFWQLVELSGFKWVYTDEIVWDSPTTYITTPLNGELPNPLPEHTCTMVWLNIERPSWENGWKINRPDFDELWICDRRWAKEVGARYFLMGGHKDAGYYEKEKVYDIITNSYDNPRRTALWSQLEGFSFAPNGWSDREYRLSHSRIAVVPQQDEIPHAVTPLRFTIAAAYHLPMVYEGETDTYPFVDGEHFIHSSYPQMADKVREALQNPDLQKIGDNLHELLCIKTNFRKEVERML
jgi:hypothetical protein